MAIKHNGKSAYFKSAQYEKYTKCFKEHTYLQIQYEITKNNISRI